MKTEKQLNKDILKITLTIKRQYPELSKYLEEMQVTIPVRETTPINFKNLKSYYESLYSLVKKYSETHIAKTQLKPVF